MKLWVSAAAGTEVALKEELRELRYAGVKAGRGGVRLEGDMRAVATICMASRIGVRVMVEVARFRCLDGDALYEGVQAVEWERWLSPERTLAVTAVARKSRLTHTNFIAQRTKDAVVDRQRTRRGRRSSVDRRDPDVAIFVHLDKDEAGVFLDAAGQSLHLRGWRERGGEAPIKETLAAAVVRLSGWDRSVPLVDPTAGAGTIPIEADLFARDVPAQAPSRRFGFERWADFDGAAAEEVRTIRERLAAAARPEGPECVGADRDRAAVERASKSATRAGSRARFEVASIDRLARDGPGHWISNPPYGHRLPAERRFWDDVRDAIARVPRHHVTLLLPEDDPPLDLAPDRRARSHRLYNGRLRCRLVTWAPR